MDKGAALLSFLNAAATLRRKRVSSYGTSDKILWFADIPRDRAECRSPFLTDKPGEFGDVWLEVRKKRMPARPPLPEAVSEWIRAEDVEQSVTQPELRSEITVIVERQVPDPAAPPGSQRTVVEKSPEVRRLADCPDVEDRWLEYLVNKWEPWAQEVRRWQEVQSVYEALDFMRRRIEESEERYEVLLAVGLLQWRDPTGASVKRHLLTGGAEIGLDAARGILSVGPSASFDHFQVEFDMLELQHRPRTNGSAIDAQLAELDIQAWDTSQLGPILREIANRLRADARVDEANFKPAERSDESPQLTFAPAIVLRERRPTAYEELIRKFQESVGTASNVATRPWQRLLLEGETQGNGADQPQGESCLWNSGAPTVARYLFPMPANDEQRRILQRLEAQPCVLVKGPPGTGKSHTIANLICHLLATGDRVLVTAQAPKALAVLRDLLPDDIRDLTLTTLGSSRDDQRLLEDGVRGIFRRRNEWVGADADQRAIEGIETQLEQFEGELATVERRLRECREAETHSHTLAGGYQGTAAQIGRRLEAERDQFSWFPDGACAEVPFPLAAADIPIIAEIHGQLDSAALEELRQEVGDVQLPDPERFSALVAGLQTATEAARETTNSTAAEKLDVLRGASIHALNALRAALVTVDELEARSRRVLGEAAHAVLADILVGNAERWNRLASQAGKLLEETNALVERLGASRIAIPMDVSEDRVMADADRRHRHFEQGGRRGFSVFSPRLVKETQYIEEKCLVDGRKPVEAQDLARVVDYLKLGAVNRTFEGLWPIGLARSVDPRYATNRANELASELRRVLRVYDSIPATSFDGVPLGARSDLASAEERAAWSKAVSAELARQNLRAAEESLDKVLSEVRHWQRSASSHPCLGSLVEAVQSRDVNAWRVAWEQRERLRRAKKWFARYSESIEKLSQACPGLGVAIRANAGNREWKSKLLDLEKAWAWSGAHAWLRRISDTSFCNELVADFHRLQRKAEAATEKLVSIRAWRAFFARLDDPTMQSLHAWTRALDRIGKGTGKHAHRHRRAARKYLLDCIPRIPAWVMPLHKLWDTVEATPGLFDTIIVDEASQAGVDSLALLLLGKRVIVVGDDKQNSPEAVGVLEDDIARLAREHLGQFRFRDEFRPDTSLFDHAERAFGSLVSLREHFRCVPEIIRFSNDLCYRDAPLIPLRQAPPHWLRPLKSQFVPQGACEGDGQRIRNRAEAEALVTLIQALVADEAYEGKSMGVIALQGHSQAEQIENLLVQRLDPKAMEERRLRCGEPASFQGDQRDVIFLSLVIAPNVHYVARNRLPDQRRFNVAMSRARDQVWLLHSVRQHDLAPDDLRRRLLNFFESPGQGVDQAAEDLERLERQARVARHRGNQPEPYESWFEVDVALELLRRKYSVRPQYEIAGRRLDLVVDGNDARLAVECDGDEWHGAEQYEHDMARQRQLERAGWTFVRVRESEFYANRQSAAKSITDACEELGIYPLDYVDESVEVVSVPAKVAETGVDVGAVRQTADMTDDGDEESAESDVSSSEYGPFSGYSEASAFPDPREASPANVRAVLRQIIESDGPLTRSSIFRLYVEGCPRLQRVGKVVRQALNRALATMLRAGEIVQEDELGEGTSEGQVLRLAGSGRVRERVAGRRDLLEIPPSELVTVLGRLFPTIPGMEPDKELLLRGVLDHYGFSRLTKSRRDYLSKVLRFRHAGVGDRGDAIEA